MKKAKKHNPFKSEVTVLNALKKGDISTRLSCILMGFGNIVRGQIIKGLIFLALQFSYIIFIASYGISFIQKLITLGDATQSQVFDEVKQIYVYTQGDNSMLCLLYGLFTVFLTAAFILCWREAVKSAYLAQTRKAAGKKVNSFKDDLYDLFDKNVHKTLLCIPVICVIVFTILPLVFMIAMAFTNYDRNHQPPGKLFDWVGLKNFGLILDSSNGLGYAFWHVLGWTLVWAVFATVLNYVLGMILALLINRKGTKWKSFWRAMFVISIAVPQFVTLLIMKTILQPEGAVNVLLKELGLISKSLPFWTDVTWARITVIVVNLWIGIPYTMIQTTGILQNIPSELYESAKVDGANAFVTFFKITLPYMLFVTTPYLITQFIGNINNFNVIYLLTEGAPASMAYHNGTAGNTDLLITWLFKLTINFKDYNYGAVIGILAFILSAVFSLIAYRNTGSYKKEEEFQ